MEIWKDIPGYEGKYMASSFGNIKSINYHRQGLEKILKPYADVTGYLKLFLCFNGKTKTFRVHKLIAITFLNHKPCGMQLVVNHKDFNRQNNNLTNLEIITQKENANQKHLKSSSQFKDVNWHKGANKWVARYTLSGKLKHLGYFKTELEARNAVINFEKELGKKILN